MLKKIRNWKHKGVFVALVTGMLCIAGGIEFSLATIAVYLSVINHNILQMEGKVK